MTRSMPIHNPLVSAEVVAWATVTAHTVIHNHPRSRLADERMTVGGASQSELDGRYSRGMASLRLDHTHRIWATLSTFAVVWNILLILEERP